MHILALSESLCCDTASVFCLIFDSHNLPQFCGASRKHFHSNWNFGFTFLMTYLVADFYFVIPEAPCVDAENPLVPWLFFSFYLTCIFFTIALNLKKEHDMQQHISTVHAQAPLFPIFLSNRNIRKACLDVLIGKETLTVRFYSFLRETALQKSASD